MLNKKYCVNTDKITWRIIDEEAIILNLDNGLYYSLNKVGAKIWELINEKQRTEQILDTLLEIYPVTKNELQGDLSGIIKELEKEQLIEKV